MDDLPGFERAQRLEKIAPRQGAGHQGAGRGDDDRRDWGSLGAGDVVGSQGGQHDQAVAAGGQPPGGIFVEQGVGLGEEQARDMGRPGGQLIGQEQGLVGAPGDEQDGPRQLAVQGSQQRQAGCPAQAEAGDGLSALQGS